jgi:cell division protein FtsQ
MLQLTDKKIKITIYLIFLFLLSTINNKNINLSNDYLKKITKIEIQGLSESNNSKILTRLSNVFYKNIFILDNEEIDRIISEYNIVEEYKARKIYPSKLFIDIKPAKIIAKISGKKEIFVGSNGKLIESEKNYENLPYIFGEFNSKKFLELKKYINLSNFNLIDLKSIFFYPSNRFDILTDNGVLIKLPENNLLKNLNLAWKFIESNELKDSALIDLRITNQLIIQ